MKTLLALLLSGIVLYAASAFADGSKQSSSASPLTHLTDSYMRMKDALVADDLAAAQKEAGAFTGEIALVNTDSLSAAAKAKFNSAAVPLKKNSTELAKAKNIEAARHSFKLVSDLLIALSATMPLSNRTIYIDYCPMKQASWLSYTKAIENPYYGKSMLTCGNITKTITR